MELIKNQEGVAEVLIYRPIGNDGIEDGIDGQDVANEIKMLDDAEDVKLIKVRVNSNGGSVSDGFSIFSAIRRAETPVYTFLDGVASSTAGWIYLAGDKRFHVGFGKFFMHEATTADGEENEATEEMNDSIRKIIVERTQMSDAKVKKAMAKETFFDKDKAISLGISTDELDFDNEPVDKLEYIKNSIDKITNNMDIKAINKELGLDSAISETQTLNKIKELVNDHNTLQKRKEELEKENKDLKEKVDKINNETAETIVNEAISNGKVDENKKEELLKTAKNDLEGFKNMLEAIPSVKKSTKIVDDINTDDGGNEKTFKELSKENPEKLKELKNENPDKYKELFKAQYGVEPTGITS